MTEEKKKVLSRLHRTEGRVHGIQEMVDEEKECIDAITQLSVVRSSVDRVVEMIVTENLRHCSEDPGKDPKEQGERLIQAINMVIKK